MCWKVPEQQKSCCISDRMSDWISNQISDMVFWGTSMTEMVQTVDQKGDFKLHQSVSQLIWRLALQEMLAHVKQWKSSLRAGQEMGCGESQFAAQKVKVSQKCSHRDSAVVHHGYAVYAELYLTEDARNDNFSNISQHFSEGGAQHWWQWGEEGGWGSLCLGEIRSRGCRRYCSIQIQIL